MTKRIVLILVILALAAAAGFGVYRSIQAQPDLVRQALGRLSALDDADPSAPLKATGIVEARPLTVSSEVGGRITALSVAEGDTVSAGQLLLALDDSLVRGQIAQAGAAVDEAQAQLELLLAGARPQEIALARARLAEAEAMAAAAQLAWKDAQLLRDNPQELDVQIAEAETAVVKAQHEAARARLQAEAIDLQVDLWGRVTQLLGEGFDVPLPGGGTIHVDQPAERDQANTQWNLSGQQAWEAWQTAYAAEEAAQAATTALADLRRQRAMPVAADARVNQAGAAYQQALAAVDQAAAALQDLEAGATPEQVQVARQALNQAKAARSALDVPLAKTRVEAPGSGLVTSVDIRLGEVAMPGVPLLEIADLSQVTLTVYVPEPELGRVALGQAVAVTVDSFPGRAFTGTVTYVADQAEFTPKDIQTQEARLNTVFAVEITLANPDGALKPGMPADALFPDKS
jgi:multidrug resistance efflux pump